MQEEEEYEVEKRVSLVRFSQRVKLWENSESLLSTYCKECATKSQNSHISGPQYKILAVIAILSTIVNASQSHYVQTYKYTDTYTSICTHTHTQT